MHSRRSFSVLLFLLLIAQSASAQTLYLPSGTGGIGSSSNGNAGIGTSSPQVKLHVDVSSYNTEGLRSSYSGNSHSIGIGVEAYASHWGAGIFQDGNMVANFENGGLAVGPGYVQQNAPSNGFIVQGHVGIGTSSPQAKLEVIGGANPFGLIVEGDGSSANARIALRRGNDTAATGNIDWIGNTNAVGARIGVNDDVAGSMAFKLGGNALSDTRLFISSAGNVGIGTTSPDEKLSIAGNVSIGGGYLALRNTVGGTAYALVHTVSNDLNFSVYGSGGWRDAMRIDGDSGSVGIGTTNPGNHKLAVNGTIRAKEVIVDTGWSDYVFKPGYKLASLSEVEAHIKAYGHLPGVPSEAQVATEGVTLGDMQAKLLAKIEELTLHQIAQEKRLAAQQDEIAALRNQVSTLSRQ